MLAGIDVQKSVTQQDKFGFLDATLALAEKVPLLLFASLVGAGLGAALALAVQNTAFATYTSEARIALKDEAAARAVQTIMFSPSVLDQVLAKFPEPQSTLDSQRRSLLEKVRLTSPANDPKRTTGLSILSVDSWTAGRARSLAGAVLDGWVASTQPRLEQKARLEKQLEKAKDHLQLVDLTIAKIIAGPLTGDLGSALSSLFDQRTAQMKTVKKLNSDVLGLDRQEVVFSEPTLPSEPSWPRLSSFAVIGSLAALVLTAIRVLLSSYLGKATNETSEKLRAIGWALRRKHG